MLTALGDHRFDITHRAVVIHRFDASTPGPELRRRASATTADAVLLTLPPGGQQDALAASTTAVRSMTDRPVIVRTSDAQVLSNCLSAGAAGVHLGSDADPRLLELAAASEAAVVVAGDDQGSRAAAARADALLELAAFVHGAGVDAERVVIDATRRGDGSQVGATSAEELARLARAGWAAMVELPGSGGPADPDPDAEAELVAAATLLVAEGARLIVTGRPRTMRRVAAVLAELLAARRGAEVGS